MTRFKELQRIEAAIEHRDDEELRWAEIYCTMRLQISTRSDHAKTWRDLHHKVQRAIQELRSGTRE